jgi:hypothetical protein
LVSSPLYLILSTWIRGAFMKYPSMFVQVETGISYTLYILYNPYVYIVIYIHTIYLYSYTNSHNMVNPVVNHPSHQPWLGGHFTSSSRRAIPNFINLSWGYIHSDHGIESISLVYGLSRHKTI